MGALEQVTQMKNKGIPEDEIIDKLKEQGISPKAIKDAMDQSKIKDAISEKDSEEGLWPSIMTRGGRSAGSSAGAQEAGQEFPNDEFYIPQDRAIYPRGPPTREYSGDMNQSYAQNSAANYGQQYYQEPYAGYGQEGYGQEYYPQEGYGEDYGYDYGGGTDIMIEIAEQVFAEKMKKIEKQIEELNEFKTLAETKLTNATTRLKRIEESIDKLQAAILEKVGFYGRGVESIKKELEMMQDSFSKTLPALVSKSSSHSSKKTTTKSRKK